MVGEVCAFIHGSILQHFFVCLKCGCVTLINCFKLNVSVKTKGHIIHKGVFGQFLAHAQIQNYIHNSFCL